LLAATFGGLLPIDILGELVSIGTLIAFIVVCIGVLVLRYTRPDLPRPFRVKGVWLVAWLGVLFCGGWRYSLPSATWWRLLIWSMIGFALYFFYGHQAQPAARWPAAGRFRRLKRQVSAAAGC
jgi:APA family basic amino acid/polyamine antiporter